MNWMPWTVPAVLTSTCPPVLLEKTAVVCELGAPDGDQFAGSKKLPLVPIHVTEVCAFKPPLNKASSRRASDLKPPADIGDGMPSREFRCKRETLALQRVDFTATASYRRRCRRPIR